MALEEGETLSRAVQQLRRACSDVSSATAELGTARDIMAREKLRQARLLATQCEEKVSGILSTCVGPEMIALRGQFQSGKSEFDLLNKEATGRERQTWRSGVQADVLVGRGEGGGEVGKGESLAVYEPVRAQEIKTVDMSEFHAEEALQREKLLGVREIEGNMMDLRTTYLEFNDLVQHQQTNLDMMTENVSSTQTYVEKGRSEIKVASRRQRCGRKMLCAIAGVLVTVIIVVIVVVVVLKRLSKAK
ncbi:Target SNARE coiled-coil homology domain [Trypanosoma melophagium]|uniref:Target SNARE coiled-coil homology domain n=1 Tax=Trypanosoma melophagium TaxID=715481 RepID=UPI00351A5AC4|nr:Target SNARE coiled-coil homology domain [Trypanosoma melophagium]